MFWRRYWQLDSINIDGYLPPAENASGANKTVKSGAAKQGARQPEDLLPIELLRELNYQLTLTVQRLLTNNTALTDIKLRSSAKAGLIKLQELSATVAEGSLLADGQLDVRSKIPAIQFSKKLTAVQIKPLLTNFADIDWVAGSAISTAKLTTSGNNIDSWIQNLKGPATLELDNAVLDDINLEKMVCEAISLVNREPLAGNRSKQTKLKTVKAKLKFANGVATNKSLAGGIDQLSIKGSGNVDLLKEQLRYNLGVRIAGQVSENSQSCRVNKRYQDIYWPIECKGKLDDDPSKLCGIDQSELGSIAGDLAEDELKRKAKDKVNEKLNNAIKRLFK